MNNHIEIPPTHPGVDLLELIESHQLTQYRLAKALSVPQTRITQIIKGRRSISADTALRLSRFFEMSKEYWLNRQMRFDLECAQISIGHEIDLTVLPLSKMEA